MICVSASVLCSGLSRPAAAHVRISGYDTTSDEGPEGVGRPCDMRDSADDELVDAWFSGLNSPGVVRSTRCSERFKLNKDDATAAAVQFQPLVVQEQNCQALMWNQGRGCMQCCLLPMPGSRLCKKHKNAPHGEVRGPIPAKKLELFRIELVKARER